MNSSSKERVMKHSTMGGLAHLPELKREALERMRTVSGHIQAIEKMITEERYCIDILKQIAAVQASLSQVAHILTKSHLHACVTEAIQEGHGEEKIEELAAVLKYLKSY
jgi:DNA-binding FrmR family transcriptional regulator